ncbi:MAG: helix-turn-helix transcriptional regulator [Clostridiaceae bacterium]
MDEFVCNIRKYRIIKELTQEELGHLVKVRRETIMRLEGGKYNPSLKLAVDISRVLDTPIHVLFIFPEEDE